MSRSEVKFLAEAFPMPMDTATVITALLHKVCRVRTVSHRDPRLRFCVETVMGELYVFVKVYYVYMLTTPIYTRAAEYNQLPSFVEPVPSHITKDDLELLGHKHALELPDYKAQQELWIAYWKYAHPCMPVLDQIQMSKSVRGCGEKISMLLYQCVILVGQVFLNAYESPRYEFADTEELLTRVRALYDLGWETRPLTILQSLLLMTLFPQRINEPKGQAYLIGHAVSMAYRMGLHRDPTHLKIKASLRHLRKRLWWSVYIRERTLVLDQGTPWIIDDTDHDVPMITIDDFCLTETSYNMGTQGSLVDLSDISRRRKIAIMWIEKAKLAVIMGRIPPISVGIPESNSRFFEKPRLQSGMLRGFQSSNDAVLSLERWRKTIAPEINFAQLDSPAWWVGDCELYIHCTTLRLLYHTVRFQLAVSQVLSSKHTIKLSRERTCQEVSVNCSTIMRIIEELQLYGYSAHVPLYGTSVLRPVLVWAILNGIVGEDTHQGSSSDPLRFDIGRVDSYQLLFKEFLRCEKE